MVTAAHDDRPTLVSRPLMAAHVAWWFARARTTDYVVASWRSGSGWRSAAAPVAAALSDPAAVVASWPTENVYLRVTTTTAAPPPGGRGTADLTGCVLGFVADLDVAGPDHAHDGAGGGLPLPPDLESAARIVEFLPAAGRMVATGGGWQCWWRLDRPLWLRTDADRRNAAALLKAHGVAVQRAAARLGWHADDISDLARILRPIGSVRRKPGGTVRVVAMPEGGADVRLPDVVAASVAVLDDDDDDGADDLDDRQPLPPLRIVGGADGPAPWTVIRAVPLERILAEDPAGQWNRIDNGGAWELWRRPSGTGEYSLKVATTGPDAGGVVVWSAVVAARCGVQPGGAVDPYGLWCALRNLDPREHARRLRRHARSADPVGGSALDVFVIETLRSARG